MKYCGVTYTLYLYQNLFQRTLTNQCRDRDISTKRARACFPDSVSNSKTGCNIAFLPPTLDFDLVTSFVTTLDLVSR